MANFHNFAVFSLAVCLGACAPVHTEGEPGNSNNVYVYGSGGTQGPAGKDGINGRNGRDGNDGTVGPQGPQGKPGPQGEPGPIGPRGPAGADGNSTQAYANTSTSACEGRGGVVVENWVISPSGVQIKMQNSYEVCYGRDGMNGQNGQDGRDGQNGQNGQDGRNGQDGQSIKFNIIDDDGCLTLRLSDVNGIAMIPLCPENGTNGVNGTNGTDGMNGTSGLTPEVVVLRAYVNECGGEEGIIIFVDYYDSEGNLVWWDWDYDYICDGSDTLTMTTPNLACEDKVATIVNSSTITLEITTGLTDCNGQDVLWPSGTVLHEDRLNEKIVTFAPGMTLGGGRMSGAWFWPRGLVDLNADGLSTENWWSGNRQERFDWCQSYDFRCGTSLAMSLPLGLSAGGACECNHSWSVAPMSP